MVDRPGVEPLSACLFTVPVCTPNFSLLCSLLRDRVIPGSTTVLGNVIELKCQSTRKVIVNYNFN